MPFFDFNILIYLQAAIFFAEGTSGMEQTTPGRIGKIGDITFYGFQPLLCLADLGCRRQEPLGVWVFRVFIDVPKVSMFNDITGVHHSHFLAHFGHDAQIMGD